MRCPYCDTELLCWDWFFDTKTGKKAGDIWTCPSGKQGLGCESETFNGYFHTMIKTQDDLKEGYPC